MIEEAQPLLVGDAVGRWLTAPALEVCRDDRIDAFGQDFDRLARGESINFMW